MWILVPFFIRLELGFWKTKNRFFFYFTRAGPIMTRQGDGERKRRDIRGINIGSFEIIIMMMMMMITNAMIDFNLVVVLLLFFFLFLLLHYITILLYTLERQV
jgi:hypothetical protein